MQQSDIDIQLNKYFGTGRYLLLHTWRPNNDTAHCVVRERAGFYFIRLFTVGEQISLSQDNYSALQYTGFCKCGSIQTSNYSGRVSCSVCGEKVTLR